VRCVNRSAPALASGGAKTTLSAGDSTLAIPEALAHYTRTYGAACRLARLGLPVFPCAKDRKEPATPRGFKDATSDTTRIAEWWGVSESGDTLPLNLGLRTGSASGLWVLDIDGEEGLGTLERLEREHGPLPATVTVATPSGGRHLYFRLPEGVEVRCRTQVFPGVDVRGEGGYVVVPPSVVGGRRYRWLRLAEVAQPPGWLLEAVAHRHKPAHPTGSRGARWCVGERNDRLFREACALRGRGYSPAELEEVLLTLNAERCDPPLPEAEVRKVAESASRYEPAGQAPGGQGAPRRRVETVSAASIKPQPVRWLWEPRVPFGALTLLVGDPGAGKSMLTCWLAAQVTQQGGAVLLVSGEDHAAAVIRPRLEAAGAHLELVHVIRVREGDSDDRLALPSDAPLLEEQARANGAQLVVIDPLSAHLDERVHSWRDQSVRQALGPLARIAEATACAVVVVAHLNKTQMHGNHPLYRVGGSIGMPAAARSVLLLARDPDDLDSDRRVLAHAKSNLSWLAPGLAMRIEPVRVDGVLAARTVIEGEVAVSAADLLDADGHGEAGARERAEAFLREVLSDGPVAVRDILAEAREEGISEMTLRRAAAGLGIRRKRLSQGNRGRGRWEWELPDNAPQDDHLANSASEKGSPQDDHPLYITDDHLANGGLSPPAGDNAGSGTKRACPAHVDPDRPDNGYRPGCRYCAHATERASSRDDTRGGGGL
jgi:hypothetical protein